MKCRMLFSIVAVLAMIVPCVVFAETELSIASFNPSAGLGTNNPAMSFAAVESGSDAGTQSAGTGCATNPIAGSQSDLIRIPDQELPINDYYAADTGTLPDFVSTTPTVNPTNDIGRRLYDPPRDDREREERPVIPEPSTILVVSLGLAFAAVPVSRRMRAKA